MIEIGDVVRIRGSALWMTVIEVSESGNMLRCSWFSGTVSCFDWYLRDVLEKVPEEEQESAKNTLESKLLGDDEDLDPWEKPADWWKA